MNTFKDMKDDRNILELLLVQGNLVLSLNFFLYEFSFLIYYKWGRVEPPQVIHADRMTLCVGFTYPQRKQAETLG